MCKNLFLIFLVLLTSCANIQSKKELQKFAREINDRCPIVYGHNCSVLSVCYSNGELRQEVMVDHNMFNLSSFEENTATLKGCMLDVLTQTKLSQRLLQNVYNANAKYVITYVDAQNGDRYILEFNNEDVKQALDGRTTDTKQAMYSHVAMTKLSLPYEVENGVVFTDTELRNGLLCCYFIVDETEYDINLLDKNKHVIKEQMINGYSDKNDALIRNELKLMISANVSLQYTYIGSETGKTFSFTIKESELKELL